MHDLEVIRDTMAVERLAVLCRYFSAQLMRPIITVYGYKDKRCACAIVQVRGGQLCMVHEHALTQICKRLDRKYFYTNRKKNSKMFEKDIEG